jgi:cytochrome bd-type quinol oxidase subunit 2
LRQPCLSHNIGASKIEKKGKNYMKYFRNSATYLVLIYVAVLGLAALLNAWYPSHTASFVHFFLPVSAEFSEQPFIRYRILLWLVATAVFIVLVPVIGYFGVPETNLEKFQRVHWGHLVVAIVALPIGWIFYPIISLCTTCVTTNDAVYFALTVSFFLALQIFAHAIILKTQLFFGKK